MTISGNVTITGNTFQTGPATFIVTSNVITQGAVEITGNAQGLSQSPVLPGVMLHITGQDNGTTPGRVYIDSNQQYSILVGRRFDGTIATPTQVLAGEEVFRLAGTGYPTGGWPTTGVAQIRFIADENQTQTNRGGHLDFLTTPVGSNVVTQVMSVSATTGVTVSGNVTASNVNINSSGTLTTPRVVINDGGLKTYSGTSGTINLNFTTDSIVHVYQPSGGITFNPQNFIAGAIINVWVQLATAQQITFGVNATNNSTDTKLGIGIGGGAPAAKNNQAVNLIYTCVDGTFANTYVMSTYT